MLKIKTVSTAFAQCKDLHSTISHKIGKKLLHIEHFVYGATYMLIGFTNIHGLYYAFGIFVFVCIIFGNENEKGGL